MISGLHYISLRQKVREFVRTHVCKAKKWSLQHIGRVQAVEMLLRNKADINVVDRFGNTPLADALRGRSRRTNAVARILEEAGAKTAECAVKAVPSVRTSLSGSLPHILQNFCFQFAETWVPTEDDTEFQLLEVLTDNKTVNSTLPHIRSNVFVDNNPDYVIGTAYR